MKKLTLETLNAHPELLADLEVRARRARAEAIGAFIVKAVRRLFHLKTPRPVRQRTGLRYG